MMLIDNGDRTMTGGPLDFICILRDIRTGRFHPCFVEERPLPGPVKRLDATFVVRVKSKMHHTTGFETFEEAADNVREDFSKRISLSPANVSMKRAIHWDSTNQAFTLILPNWVKDGRIIDDVLAVDVICGEPANV